MDYYVDTCIWLNLFKKEFCRNILYWQIAKDFIERVLLSGENNILYSGIVLRELQIKLSGADYESKRRFFAGEARFVKIEVLNEDKISARQLESDHNFEISFYDFLHIVLAKRMNSILVTRDKKLIHIAVLNGVVSKRPEEL